MIGDELCHETKVNSGIAITAGTTSTLVKKKSSFIFATHMHDILNVSVINKLIDNKELDVKTSVGEL